MCKKCRFAGELFRAAEKSPHMNYFPALAALREMERQGRLALLAGDCPLDEAAAQLEGERHYTVCHYLRCRGCGAVYFLGACIRGEPVFRALDSMKGEAPDKLLWGRAGLLYDSEAGARV